MAQIGHQTFDLAVSGRLHPKRISGYARTPWDVGDIVRGDDEWEWGESADSGFGTCIFCELVAGNLPISVIDETEDF